MAVTDRNLLVELDPTVAAEACRRAFASAGFDQISVDPVTGVTSGRRRNAMQWTRDIVQVRVDAAPGGSFVRVHSEAVAQSLAALAKNPSKMAVDRFVMALIREVPVTDVPTAAAPAPVAPVTQPPAPAPYVAPPASVADELGRLAELHRQGMLSEDEFAAAKAQVIG